MAKHQRNAFAHHSDRIDSVYQGFRIAVLSCADCVRRYCDVKHGKTPGPSGDKDLTPKFIGFSEFGTPMITTFMTTAFACISLTRC
jgi:hypothetical protein